MQKDRYKPTQYQDELKMLAVKDNRSYTEKRGNSLETKCIHNVSTLETERKQNGNSLETQYSIDKNRIVESSIGEIIEESLPQSQQIFFGEYENVILSEKEYEKLKNEFPDYEEKIDKFSSYLESSGKTYKSHYATIRKWAKEDAGKKQPKHAGSNIFLELLHDMEG